MNAIFASPAAIDLRFDTPLDRNLPSPYIYSGFDLIPSHWYPVGSNSFRITPDRPLESGRTYRLALDAHTDYPLRIAADRTFALLKDTDFDGRMLRIHFDREVDTQSVEVTALDGTPIRCFIDRSTDGRTLRITLSSPQPKVIVTTPQQTSRFEK